MEVYKGRWGWYAVSYSEFVELKQKHKEALHDMRMAMKHFRWERKTVHKIGPEPPLSDFQQGSRFSDLEMKEYYWRVLASYRKARYPLDTQEEAEKVKMQMLVTI